jgi:transposase-like protein
MTKHNNLSDLEKNILKEVQSGTLITDAFKPMIKRIMEAALEAEMALHLEDNPDSSNRRNGKSRKTLKTSNGYLDIETPRDRDSSFEPQLVKKRERVLTGDLDQKILSLFASGMSYSDIQHNLKDIYGVDICDGSITQITDKLLPEIRNWQERPLQEIYPILFLDAMHFKIREEGRVVSKAVYTLLAIDKYGMKDILGLYISDTESAAYWSQVLASLKERGVKDIMIACTDNLTGFEQAIHSVFPKTEQQLCIIHQIRNSLRYVASKDQKAFMGDLKLVYRASSKQSAEEYLLDLECKWGKKYPAVLKSWHANWERLSAYFKYDPAVRKVIYTTNAVEGLHRMVRKYTKSKGAFTSQNALAKVVFSAYKTAYRKWNMPISNWGLIASQLDIHFPNRNLIDL